MKRLLCLLAGLWVGSAGAVEYGAEIRLDRNGDKFPFMVTIENTSDALPITTFEVALSGNSQFDTSTSPTEPDIGANNNGVKSSTVEWNVSPLVPGEIRAITGDIDGDSPIEATVTVEWTDGQSFTVVMPIDRSSPFPNDKWEGSISEGEVEPPPPIIGEGQVLLSWVPPSENEDDTPLAIQDITSYTLLWGEEPGSYTDSMAIPGGSTTSQDITIGLTGDTTFYFAMTATSDNGTSDLSNVVQKSFTVDVVDPPDPPVDPKPPTIITVMVTLSCVSNEVGVVCEATEVTP